MHFDVDKDLRVRLEKLKSKDKILAQRIEKQLELFAQNHLHPSLRTHKLAGKLENFWSISIDKRIRMVFTLDERGAYFIDIGTHDQVYK